MGEVWTWDWHWVLIGDCSGESGVIFLFDDVTGELCEGWLFSKGTQWLGVQIPPVNSAMEVHMIVRVPFGQTFDGLRHVLRVACTKSDDPLHGGK